CSRWSPTCNRRRACASKSGQRVADLARSGGHPPAEQHGRLRPSSVVERDGSSRTNLRSDPKDRGRDLSYKGGRTRSRAARDSRTRVRPYKRTALLPDRRPLLPPHFLCLFIQRCHRLESLTPL